MIITGDGCCLNSTISMQHSEVVEDHLPSRSEDNEQIDVEQRDTQEGEDVDNESGNREINEVRGCAYYTYAACR